MNSKQCVKCNNIMDLNKFHKNKANKDGYSGTCKKCRKKYMNKYQSTDEYKEQRKKYRKPYCKINSKLYRISVSRVKLTDEERKTRQQERNRIKNGKRRAIQNDNTINKGSLKKLYKYQDAKCGICGIELKGLILTLKNGKKIDGKQLDHIIPISKGGKHSIFNVWRLCYKCNLKKSNNLDLVIFIITYMNYML